MRFELFGYTIVEDLFTEQELQSLEASASRLKAEILDGVGDVEITPPPPPRKYEDFRDGAIWRANRRRTASGDLHMERMEIENVLGLDPIYLSILTRPRVLGIATELLGGDVSLPPGRRPLQQAFRNPRPGMARRGDPAQGTGRSGKMAGSIRRSSD